MNLFWLLLIVAVIYLAGRSLFGKAYSIRRFFTDLGFTALMILAGFGLAFMLLTVLP